MRWLGNCWFIVVIGVVILLWDGWRSDHLLRAAVIVVAIGAMANIVEEVVKRHRARRSKIAVTRSASTPTY